jgi:hypothetical protein
MKPSGAPISGTVRDARYALLPGAMRAAVERLVCLDPVPHDLASAVIAHGCQAMDGTLEAVEGVGMTRGDDLKGEVVLVAADFAGGHGNLLGEGSLALPLSNTVPATGGAPAADPKSSWL